MCSSDSSSEFLAVVLSSHELPSVVKLSAVEATAPSICLAGTDYLDSGAGDWLGFYDWLRNPQGVIIGVQQWIDEIPTFPFAKRFDGVEANMARGVLRIFFAQTREVEEKFPQDQDFGGNRLLVNGESVVLTYNNPHWTAPIRR
jgi:hypothetical protein